MSLARWTAIGLVPLALALASCSTRRPAPTPRPAPVVIAPPSAAPSPAFYVESAASIDLLVVRASDLLLQRSRDPAARALAARLGAEHRGLAAQLSLAGRRLDLLPSARLLSRHQQILDALARRQPTDAAFVQQMMLIHHQSLALHAAFAARGASATLRPVAAHAERVERAHLARLTAS
jgi:putative membrane protein